MSAIERSMKKMEHFIPAIELSIKKMEHFIPLIERFIKNMECSISADRTSIKNMERSRLATNHSLPTIERFTTDRGRFAKLGQFCREILNDYAAIVQPLHTAQPQPAAHQQYDRTSLAPRCHPPEAELRQPQRAGNTSRQQPTLSIWRFAIPACKRGKDAAVEVCPSRHSRHSSPLCRFAWNRPPAVASNRGAQQPGAAVLPAAKARSTAGEGWRSVPLRVSETPLRSGAWGWLQFFAASDREPVQRQGLHRPRGRG
jgi:hypothetical protein